MSQGEAASEQGAPGCAAGAAGRRRGAGPGPGMRARLGYHRPLHGAAPRRSNSAVRP